jgi:hypothetical protein
MRPRVLLHGLLALPGLTVLVMYAGSGDGRIPPPSDVADPVLVRRVAASNGELQADSVRSTSAIIRIDTARVDSVRLWYTRHDTVQVPMPSPPIKGGIPFGAWECTAPDNLGPFNLCIRSAGSWITPELKALQPFGGKLLLSQGGYSKFQNPDKTYNAEKYYDWVQSLKPQVKQWQRYLADGTLMGVQVIDDIGKTNWGGVPITKAQIEEMSKWWKELMPGITTFVREKATGLAGYPWEYLDGSITQYNARYMGDITKWRDSNVVAARDNKLALMLSLNVLNGGKVVPGCYHADEDEYCAMTPIELLSLGAVQIATPEACGVATWKISPTYLAQPGIADAFKSLATLAALRSALPCRRPR